MQSCLFRQTALTALLILACVTAGVIAGETKAVTVIKTPNGGIQPRSLTDAKGVLHLLYFLGDSGAGDLYYVRRRPGEKDFSGPLRVNNQRSSAVAIGTIRGGQIAVGKNGRVHVAWNGSSKALPRGPGRGSPMLYARLNEAGTAFEPQRNLMQTSEFLDGGGTVTADRTGNVLVAWHGLKTGTTPGENNRRVWVAVSHDDGKTFADEVPAFDQETGACGCCGMGAFTDSNGNHYLIYRAAGEHVNRDIWLLASSDWAKTFRGQNLHKWNVNVCPMSSEDFAEGPGTVYAAWDTKGQVYFATIKPGGAVGEPQSAPGEGKARKHPRLAVNKPGEAMLVWTEGTGWQRGGALAWQIYDRQGRPTSLKGHVANAIPVWGCAAVVTNADGTFTIFH